MALLAGSGFGESRPPLETTFSQIEQFGHRAGRMVGRAIDRLLAEQHAAHFKGEQPCPTCHEMHPPNEQPHTLPLQTLDGEVPLPEPAFNCSPCRRAFFPQRPVLKIDGGPDSPAILEKKALVAAHVPSYEIGAVLLREVGGISITGRGLNTVAVRIGTEMIEERDARTEAYFNAPLPRQYTQPEMPIALACVSIDGGRMQTRTEGCGKGVHHAHWRENKNALFMRMKSDSFTCDPHPELPACSADPEKLKSLLPGVIGDGTSPLGIKTPPTILQTAPAIGADTKGARATL